MYFLVRVLVNFVNLKIISSIDLSEIERVEKIWKQLKAIYINIYLNVYKYIIQFLKQFNSRLEFYKIIRFLFKKTKKLIQIYFIISICYMDLIL